MSSDIFLYHALWHILEIDTALVRIMRERRQCHVSSDSSLKFTFFYNTDHAREKTMPCELRHLLERCYALPIDIVTQYMIYFNIKTTYIILWYYMTTSIFMKTMHLKKNHLHHNHQTICQTSWQESISRCNGFVQVQGGAYNEASEGLEQTI